MNFIDAKIQKGDGVVAIINGDNELTVLQTRQRLYRWWYDGKTVTMGIRPENIHDASVDTEFGVEHSLMLRFRL